MTWFYISFAKAKKDGGHLGSTVVEASDPDGALAEATRRGLNPGGEAQIIPVPARNNNHPEIVPLRNRLVSKAELARTGGIRGGYHKNSSVVCQECNE
jgi:hypothetical protein